jgi:hypothetical protein
MKSVKNTARKPITVPLPKGKKLHLAPNQTGQISTHDVEHPPLVKLIEAGELEILGEGSTPEPLRKNIPGVHEAPHGGHGEVSAHHRGER